VLEMQAKAINDITAPPRTTSPGASWRSSDHWIWAAAALLVVVVATLLIFKSLLQDTSAASRSTGSDTHGDDTHLTWEFVQPGMPPDGRLDSRCVQAAVIVDAETHSTPSPMSHPGLDGRSRAVLRVTELTSPRFC
jgi:hypothetical protein